MDDSIQPISNQPITDGDLWAIARRAREAAADELAEIEYETERAEVKRQDLTARSLRAMMEGEWWQVRVGNRAVDGVVVHPGQDYTGLQDRVGNLHDVVHHAIGVIRVTGADPAAGRAPTTFRPATFRARLLGLEQVREVELGAGDGSWSVLGTIDSVNADHLVALLRDSGTAIVPIDAIGYMSRTAQPSGPGGPGGWSRRS